jgi:hypothetical protein
VKINDDDDDDGGGGGGGGGGSKEWGERLSMPVAVHRSDPCRSGQCCVVTLADRVVETND